MGIWVYSLGTWWIPDTTSIKGVATTHLNFKHHPEDERKGIMCNKVFLSTACLSSTDQSNMRCHCEHVEVRLTAVTVGKWKHGCGLSHFICRTVAREMPIPWNLFLSIPSADWFPLSVLGWDHVGWTQLIPEGHLVRSTLLCDPWLVYLVSREIFPELSWVSLIQETVGKVIEYRCPVEIWGKWFCVKHEDINLDAQNLHIRSYA